jgi:cobalt-zinc-cadmium resistance protein CzcA
VPAVLCMLLVRNPNVVHKEPAGMSSLRQGYLWALQRVLNAPRTALTVSVVILAAALALVPSLGREFLPQMNEGDLHITITMPSTISLEEGQRTLGAIRRELATFDEVQDVVTEQGHPEDGSDDEAPNQGKAFVMLKPPSAWPQGTTMATLTEAMRERLSARPGIAYNFSQPIKDRIEEAISGVRGQVVVKMFGEDLSLMHSLMGDVRKIIAQTPGAQDVEIYRAGQAQHVVADIDRAAVARLGVSIDDVQDVIESAFGGRLVTEMFEKERRVGVRIKLPTPKEGDVTTVARLAIPLPTGGYVPLSTVAQVHNDAGRTQINREQLSRFLALKCNISGRDMGTFVDAVQQEVAAQVHLPEGYYLTWGGEFDNQRRAMHQLSIIVPISIGVILMLLYATFNAWLPALVVLVGLPFAAVGGIVALFVTHTTLSVSAVIGFITLFGVATMDGVLLISYVREAMRGQPDGQTDAAGQEVVMQAVSQRLRPVLMTALLASLGLLPAATSHAIGSDTQRPFAVVIIGGLISATVLTMLLLPSLYGVAERATRGLRLGGRRP